jgi:hypothetical protein
LIVSADGSVRKTCLITLPEYLESDKSIGVKLVLESAGLLEFRELHKSTPPQFQQHQLLQKVLILLKFYVSFSYSYYTKNKI